MDRSLFVKEGKEIALPVAAGTLIELGHMAAVNAAGYLVMAQDTAGLKVMGVAGETVDNTTGADGDVLARVFRAQSFLLNNAATGGVTQANVGSDVFVNNSVTVAASGGVAAGKLLAIDAEGPQVWIG